MSFSRYQRRLTLLLLYLWFQRAFRLLIRVIWTGFAGYMIGWGLNSLFGWFPDDRMWVVLGIGFASFSLITIFIPTPRFAKTTWRADRYFALDEQLSTAWQVSQRKESGQLAELLVADSNQLLPDVYKKVSLRGWFLARDLTSMLIVLVLFWLVFMNDLTVTPIELPDAQAEMLPALGEDPTYGDIFPSGIPGLKPEEPSAGEMPGQPVQGETDESSQAGESDSPGSGGNVETALKNLGGNLSELAVSYEAGQALQNGDFDQAADEMETLSDQVSQLSEESKQEISEAMERAAEDIDQGSGDKQEPISENLAAAASSLAMGNDSDAQGEMDQISNRLREMSEAQAGQSADQALNEALDPNITVEGLGQGGIEGGTSAGARSISEPAEFSRISGEGEILELGQANDQSGLLKPGLELEDRGSDIARGSLSSNLSGDSEVIDSILTPYYFNWEWRYVVATYFTPD